MEGKENRDKKIFAIHFELEFIVQGHLEIFFSFHLSSKIYMTSTMTNGGGVHSFFAMKDQIDTKKKNSPRAIPKSIKKPKVQGPCCNFPFYQSPPPKKNPFSRHSSVARVDSTRGDAPPSRSLALASPFPTISPRPFARKPSSDRLCPFRPSRGYPKIDFVRRAPFHAQRFHGSLDILLPTTRGESLWLIRASVEHHLRSHFASNPFP